jgi:hypothetical protein
MRASLQVLRMLDLWGLIPENYLGAFFVCCLDGWSAGKSAGLWINQSVCRSIHRSVVQSVGILVSRSPSGSVVRTVELSFNN